MSIKWTPALNKQLQAQVKRFNAKIEREAKKHPGMRAAYPEKITIKQVKSRIENKKDIRVFENSVNRLFQPKALDLKVLKSGVITTNWQIKDLQLKTERINRERKRELVYLKERKLLPTRHKSDYESSLSDKKADLESLNRKDQRSWDKFVKSVEKQSSPFYRLSTAQNRRDGYIYGLVKTMGYQPEILDRLYTWSAEKFMYAYLNYPEFIPSFYYDTHTSLLVIKERILQAMDAVDADWSKRSK